MLDTELQGQLHSLRGNQPILLNDAKTAWVIQSGEIALFACPVEAGVAEGVRHYLFSASAGDALLGIPSALASKRLSLLAVPLVETRLIKVRSTHLWQLVANKDRQAIALVEAWIHQLATKSHLHAIERQKISSFSFGQDTIQGRLATVYAHFSHYLDRLEQVEQVKQRLRFGAREHFNRRATAEALEELVSLVQHKDAGFDAATSALLFSGKSEFLPLMIAVGAIGRTLGVAIRAPKKWDTFDSDSLSAIALAHGLRMRQVLLRDSWWKEEYGPLLAFTWPDNRPVALLPTRRDTGSRSTYELFDPGAGTRTLVDASVAANLILPDAYTFYRPLPERVRGGWELLRFALNGRVKELRGILWSSIAVTILGILTPQATAILIDYAIPSADREILVQIGLGLIAATLGATTFQLAQGLAILRLESFADVSTQAAVWDRLLNLPVPFFRQYSTGDLQSRVSAISEIRRLLSGTALVTLFSSVFTSLNLVLLFYYSWRLAIAACVFTSVAVAGTTVFSILILRQMRPLQAAQGKIFGLVLQLINGVAKLQVAGSTERAFAHWAKTYSQQVKLMLSTQHLEDYLAVFNTVLPTICSGFLFWVAVFSIKSGGLSTGTFLAFNLAFGVFVSGIATLSESATKALEIVTLWEHASPILAAQPEVNDSKADPGLLSGQLALDRVSFRYRDDGALILKDVSLYAEPGEMIALVGPSGSGKSTVLRLLLGFETPSSGQVYYDGQELRGLDVYSVRRQLGVVLQNSRLTAASIFENISCGATVLIEEAWEAVRQVGLADEIAAMPMAMHTIVSEGGTNLSGGQRQRLLLARALVSKPRVLLLDEATSFLDNKSQAIASASLDKLKVTRVVIAHRLSTIRHADRIYVLEAGRVVQQGRFEQLANQEGLFARLMQRQTV